MNFFCSAQVQRMNLPGAGGDSYLRLAMLLGNLVLLEIRVFGRGATELVSSMECG